MSDFKKKKKVSRFLKILGPGFITGAADNDPSGIATYSQAGAQFGYGQLWASVFLYPLMTAVQEASARIGAVTKQGITAVVKTHYPRPILYCIVTLVFIANTINIGANIGAMAAALELITPIPFAVATLVFVSIMLLLQVFIPYKHYVRILKWLVVVTLVYPLTLLFINAPWEDILQSTIIPRFEFTPSYIFLFTAIIGTTISPYMFFWQASEEVEEEIQDGEILKPIVSKSFVHNMRIDNALGMLFSQIAAWSIIATTGTVLHANGVLNIETAADAARALEPLVQSFPGGGYWAQFLFATGIIGLGLLSVPVLAGSAAYAMAEALKWNEGLYRKLKEAHGFYGVITISTLLGLSINFVGIDPFRALIITAVLNAIVSVPLIFLIVKISSNREIMGHYVSGTLSKCLLWITFLVVFTASIATIITIL